MIPQMKPYNWLNLMFILFIIFIIFIIKIYFNYSYLMKTKLSKKLYLKSWKWMW